MSQISRPCLCLTLAHLLFSLLLSACAPGIVSTGARPTQSTATLPVPSVVSDPVTPTQSLTTTPTPPQSISLTDTPPLPTRKDQWVTCGAKTGSLEKGAVETALLAKPMLYTIYLPPCYSVDVTIRYPVLYLLHGQGYTEDQWLRLGAVSVADQLISSGETRPFMMVFPLDTATKQPAQYNFEQVFTHLLLATVDDNHRTLSTPAARAIGGISRGGAWALHLGLEHPDLFGTIGGHSASIFYSDESTLQHILLTMPVTQMPRIWLDAGDTDVELGLIAPFEVFMTEHDIPHEWHEYVGSHEEKYWSAHVHEYLEWYTQAWR